MTLAADTLIACLLFDTIWCDRVLMEIEADHLPRN
jgi:hypothetical protein